MRNLPLTVVAQWLNSMGLLFNLTVDCMSVDPSSPNQMPSPLQGLLLKHAAHSLQHASLHLYGCLQHSKKFHPLFSDVLLEILKRDHQAKILVLQGAQVRCAAPCTTCASWSRSLAVRQGMGRSARSWRRHDLQSSAVCSTTAPRRILEVAFSRVSTLTTCYNL
jgi:hypothetical protein